MVHKSFILSFFIIAGGFTVLTIGSLLLVLPGPGIPLVIIGLSLLSAEFLWARHLLKKLKMLEKDVKKELKRDFSAF